MAGNWGGSELLVQRGNQVRRRGDIHKMLRIRSVSILVAFAFVLIASGAPSVFADSITFNLDTASTLGDGNYGTVTMTLVNIGTGGQKIKIEVVLNNGARLIQTGH